MVVTIRRLLSSFLIESRLSAWKAKHLSLAARATLIKDTLTIIPIYSMQSIGLPSSVCDAIDQSVRSFLWDNKSNGGGVILLIGMQ